MVPTSKAVEDCPIAREAGEDLASETVTAIRFCVCDSSDDISEPFARAADYLDSFPHVTVVATSWTEGPCDSGQGCHLTLELIVRGETEPDIQPSALERAEAHTARGQIDAAATANGWSFSTGTGIGSRYYDRADFHIRVSYTPAGVVCRAYRHGGEMTKAGWQYRDVLSRRDHDKAATVLGWISEHAVEGP